MPFSVPTEVGHHVYISYSPSLYLDGNAHPALCYNLVKPSGNDLYRNTLNATSSSSGFHSAVLNHIRYYISINFTLVLPKKHSIIPWKLNHAFISHCWDETLDLNWFFNYCIIWGSPLLKFMFILAIFDVFSKKYDPYCLVLKYAVIVSS